GSVQSRSQLAVSRGEPLPPSHCSTPVWVSPSPHTLNLHARLQRLPGPLLAPSSHCSPASSTPSGQLTSVQFLVHGLPTVPLAAPLSQASVAAFCLPSPHTL